MRHLKEIQQIKNAMEAATPKVTQEIIAEKTGKSTSLVSNVIRDRYSVIVSEETIGKVQSAINKAVGRDVFATEGTAKEGPSATEGVGEGEVGSGASRVAASPDASNTTGVQRD